MFYAPLVSFNPEQRQVAQGFTRAPSYAKAGPLARQALLEAGIVESTLRRDPSERNLDSRGALQQRASQGWGTVAEELNPTTAAEMFLRHAIPLEGRYHDAGQLAQAVQRSAYPGRYDEHAAEAAQLLAQLGGSRQGHEALKAAGVNPQSPNIAALLQAITAPQSAPAAGIAIPRPVTSGGPEQASTGPRLPAPLTPAPAPASPDVLMAAIQQLTEKGGGGGSGGSSEAAGPQSSSSPVPQAAGSYGALAGAGLQFAGDDQGVDFTGAGVVRAPADMRITRVASNTGWSGEGNILVGQILSGPQKGRYQYIAEDFRPAGHLKPGSVVRAGEALGRATGSGKAPGIEVGFAQNARGQAYGTTHDGKAGGPAPVHGNEFARYLQSLARR